MKYIKTKSKEEFLQYDFNNHYNHVFKDYEEYLIVIGDCAISCKNCGIYYWYECEKLCSCKN